MLKRLITVSDILAPDPLLRDCVVILICVLCHSESSEESNYCNILKNKILRLKPQNDIATHSLLEERVLPDHLPSNTNYHGKQSKAL